MGELTMVDNISISTGLSNEACDEIIETHRRFLRELVRALDNEVRKGFFPRHMDDWEGAFADGLVESIKQNKEWQETRAFFRTRGENHE